MIPLMKNTFLNEVETKKALANFIIHSSRLSMDQKCAEFESRFSEYQKTEHAVLFNSGGSANLAVLQTLKNMGKLKEGDIIGFSALTWATNVMPIIQLGLVPVPIDITPETLNVMADNLEESLSKNSFKAVFITNALGFCGDLKKIRDICDKNDILFIEDNCEALGSEVSGIKTGNFGELSSFSFFVAHHMSTIEGGMVCTNSEDLAEMLKIVRANGWGRNLTSIQQHKWRRQLNVASEFDAKYSFYDLGFNFRPTEITGFIGCYQLQFLEDNISARERNFLKLKNIVEENDELIQLKHDHMNRLSCFAYPVLCKTPELKVKYMSLFAGAGIEIRPMIAGNIQKQPFYQKYVRNMQDLPGNDFVHNCGFYCGNYPELTKNDLETIRSCLRIY